LGLVVLLNTSCIYQRTF